jgi:hydrophobe/amphiphile efflux-3 (HAE3) family protein
MTKFIIRFRWIIIAACILLGAGFAVLIPQAKTDPEIRNYVPQNMSSRIATDKIEHEFGVQDMVIILFSDSSILTPENLKQIKDIDKDISRLNGVSSQISPFTIKSIKGEEGMMIVDPLINKITSDTGDLRKLRESIIKNRFARDIVFSSDMTTASITATISNAESENVTLHQIDSVISSHPGKARILTGGLPYIRQFIMKDVRKDAIFLIPAALIIMLLILKFTLGDWKSVFMPFTVVILSTAVSMGLIPLLGWKISILSLLVPIIIVAVANNYGIYLVARYQELSKGWNGSSNGLLRRLTGSLNMPILFSGLTTIAGILGLLTHSIIPARQVGILAAAGVTIALLMSLTYIPALIFVLGSGTKKIKPEHIKQGFFERVLGKLSHLIINFPRRILIVAVVLTIFLSLGIIFLKIETNQENYFPKKHPVRLASGIINSKFGGSQTISVMIDGDIKDPVILQKIDNLTLQLEKIDGVGNVFSISQVVREMSKAIYSKEEKEYDNIPGSRNAIAQMFELYNMSGDQNDFKQLMNMDNSKAHMLIKLSKPENKVINNVREKINGLTSDISDKITVGGYAIIMADFAGSVIKGQGSSLIFAMVTVFILLAIIFKSIKGGLIGSIPLGASIFILFGFMGLTGIALDSATALLSSIMIGVGVDFTIQYMWCFNIELRKGLTYEEATVKTLATIGRSIIINAFSVMAGFSALMFSGFTSIRFFGYLVLISIGSCLIGAIIIIPAFLIIFKPKFISMDLNNRKNRKYEKSNNPVNLTSAAFTGSTATA